MNTSLDNLKTFPRSSADRETFTYDAFQTIEDLLKQIIIQQDVSIVEVADRLLELTPATGVKIEKLADRWVVHTEGKLHIIFGTSRPLSMLRSVAARIAVLSNETTGQGAFLYGGEGDIIKPKNFGTYSKYHVKTMNTPSQVWLEIVPIKDVT